MNTAHTPVEVAILAFPETTASVTYGMYDLFMAAATAELRARQAS